MYLLKSVLRIVVLTLVGIVLIGCFCINSIMFHPVRQYDAGHPGYVDIGTNGVKGLDEYRRLLTSMNTADAL